MISKHHTVFTKTLTVSLAVILGVGVFANSSSALFVCSTACCMDSRTALISHHTPKLTSTAPCCCSDAAAFPCEYTDGPVQRLSPPALLRAHKHDHRDITIDRTDKAAAPAFSPETTGSPAGVCFAAIHKVPVYLTTLTFLC